MIYWVRGCPTGPRETSAGLQPARLDKRGNRVFTPRKATSIGLKPIRPAMHYTTYNTYGQIIPALQHTASPAAQMTTAAPQHTATPARKSRRA